VLQVKNVLVVLVFLIALSLRLAIKKAKFAKPKQTIPYLANTKSARKMQKVALS
jgi:hypothetical protein